MNNYVYLSSINFTSKLECKDNWEKIQETTTQNLESPRRLDEIACTSVAEPDANTTPKVKLYYKFLS